MGAVTRPLAKGTVRRLGDEELLERVDLLVEACMHADQQEMPLLRQQLDLVNREGERRKLICWMLPPTPPLPRSTLF